MCEINNNENNSESKLNSVNTNANIEEKNSAKRTQKEQELVGAPKNTLKVKKSSCCWAIAISMLLVVLVIPAVCALMCFTFFFSVTDGKTIWALLIAAVTLVLLFVCLTIMIIACIHKNVDCLKKKEEKETYNALLQAYKDIFSK